MESYKESNMPLFETESRYIPGELELNETSCKLKEAISKGLGKKVVKLIQLGNGQNVNFKVYTSEKEEPGYLLRIITMNGYPSIGTLDECYKHLDTAHIMYSKKVFCDLDSDIVPYGYLVQEWIEGDDALEVFGEDGTENNTKWLEDFAGLLKKVHTIKLPYFGYLGNGPKYESLKEYYYNMDKIIDNSYGKVFKGPYTIWDLDKYNITSPGFLKYTFDCVKELADKITSQAQSVLIHGDMLPQNLIYTKNGPVIIDWDETRANWWVYEIARASYYLDSKSIISDFIKIYNDCSLSTQDIYIGVKLEHIRQLLRYLFMAAFSNPDMNNIKSRVKEIEDEITEKINEGIGV